MSVRLRDLLPSRRVGLAHQRGQGLWPGLAGPGSHVGSDQRPNDVRAPLAKQGAGWACPGEPAGRLRRTGDQPGGRVPRRPTGHGRASWTRSTWKSRPTCGRASGCCAAAQAPRWSAAMPESPTGSRSTPRSASPSSSCPGTRTSRRPTGSAKAYCPYCASTAADSIQRRTARTTSAARHRSPPRQVLLSRPLYRDPMPGRTAVVPRPARARAHLDRRQTPCESR
jgi:hypothetical protein